MKHFIYIIIASMTLSSCTVYTERRSEALSQAVFATSDSIQAGRFDLADSYSKEAEKLAFPPKKKVEIKSIYTKRVVPKPVSIKPKQPVVNSVITPDVSASDEYERIRYDDGLTSNATSVPTPSTISKVTLNDEEDVLRIVVPEKFKDAELLVEGSSEWDSLIQTKDFYNKLKIDHENLKKLKNGVDEELLKQQKMHDKMISDLNAMQKKLAEKDVAIWKRNLIILIISLIFAICGYLRIKGIL